MPKTNDLAAVRAILDIDRGWTAYALADLAPPYRAHSEWHAACRRPALLLIYRAFRPPVLIGCGAVEDLKPVLAEVASEPEMYLAVRHDVPDLIRSFGYVVRGEKPMLRMVLEPVRFILPADRDTVRLGPEDYDSLLRLYADGAATAENPLFFDASMLRHGVYFGIREGDTLVAAAGTHVFAPEEGVAGLGNVYTRRDRRGRGFGSRTTAAVTAELLRSGIRTVALNVHTHNNDAIRAYERLGFIQYCYYCEAIATRSA